MRFRGRPRLVAGGALLVAAGFALALAGRSHSEHGPVPPAALNRIAANNEEAAVQAAARQRATSQAQADAADDLRAAGEKGRAAAIEEIRRHDDAVAGEPGE